MSAQTLQFRSQASFAARYQKTKGKAIGILGQRGFSRSATVLLGPLANHGQGEFLSLKCLHQ